MLARTLLSVRSAPPVIVLIATNLVPLIGVAFWGWQLGTVMVLYWLENGVIGVVTVARILLRAFAPLPAAGSAGPAPRPDPFDIVASLGTAAFFLVHYGIFWVVHGIFVFTLFVNGSVLGGSSPFRGSGNGAGGADGGAVLTGLIALTLYHVVAFIYWDVIHGEARRARTQQLVGAPYPRLIVLHMTIIVGAFLVAATGQAIAPLALLVLLKTALDLGTQSVPRLSGRPGPVRTTQPPVPAIPD